jgi:murein DD-endopeptidase MepM/ murein hydrolase activator NlpD
MAVLSPAVNLDPNPAKGGGDITVVGGAALAAQDSPGGTPTTAEDKPQSSQISIYTVRSGDTLSEIAEMFNVSVNTIIWANDIKGRVIQPGQVLIILPVTGLRHSVEKGETLATIAKKYKGDVNEIASYNELAVDASLTAGQVVIIPNGEVAPPTASKSTSSGTAAKKTSSTPTAALHDAGGPALSGYYTGPVSGIITQSLHGYNGVDIGAPAGTPIYAAADGVVIIAKDNGAWNGGYGNYVVIQHDNNTQTLYAHALSGSIGVSLGDHVSRGQTIAKVGRTGEATGYHLHFEVRGAANPLGSVPVGSRI